MELVVHGTKQGYKSSFIPNVQPTFSLGDIRNGVNNENPLGKSVYSLAFINGGYVFSKYTIVRDTLRSYAIGNVAFSLFLPAHRELSGKGEDVKSLLDSISRDYIDNYVRENNVNRGEATLIQEDWSFLQKISSEFTEQNKRKKDEEIPSGTSDPAIHYYKSDIELIEHLDEPFQEEYSNYKQILFIESNLKGDSNPLNVLKHSGVEVNPDLKNEYYYLNEYNSSIGIKITANGTPRSDKNGENQIRAKWKVEINYSKDNRCYEPINAEGTISDKSSEIHKYLEERGNNQIMLKYDAFNNPKEREIPVTFEIKDRNEKSVEGAEIQIGDQLRIKVDDSKTTVKFKGEEIIKQWKISASKDSEKLYSNTITVKPDKQNDTVVLTLQKQNVVKIHAIERGNGIIIPNFKLWCNDGKGYRENVSEIIFVNDDIYKPWEIEVSKKEERYSYSGKIKNYYPATGENPLYVPCEKMPEVPSNNKTYKIDAGENGKKTKNCPVYSYSSSGNDLDKNCIIANNGYAFINKWELKNNTLFAQYENKKSFFKSRTGIATSIVSAIFLGFGIWAAYYFLGKDNQPNETFQNKSNNKSHDKVDSSKPIANKSNDIPKPKEPSKEETPQKPKREEKKPEQKKGNSKINEHLKEPPSPQDQKTTATYKTAEIVQYIKGTELNKDTLQEYLKINHIPSKLKKSIQLCLDFWDLGVPDNDHKSETYYSFKKKIDSDKYLSESNLKKYLDSVIKKANPSYSKQDKIMGLKK